LRFLDVPVSEERNYSEETARAIDAEVRSIVENERSRARSFLAGHRDKLEAIAARLLEVETLERDELEKIVLGKQPLIKAETESKEVAL
jgi:cell division protease FtsH